MANGEWRSISPFAICHSLFLIALLLTGCTSTRPMVKIGLIAPFEGLYREDGYAALAAMRAAIAESDLPAAHGMDVLPLAVDDSADPARSRRAAQKLLADPAVKAMVGPLFPEAGEAVGKTTTDPGTELDWLPGYAIAGEDWADTIVRSVADHARTVGVTRLVLAGATAGWPAQSLERWSDLAGMAVGVDDGSGSTLRAGDGVLWLGMPAPGAVFLAGLDGTGLAAPFWLAPWAGGRVFAQHADLAARDRSIFQTAWTDDGYADWAAIHTPNTPFAYQIYRATQMAIAAALDPADGSASSTKTGSWRMEIAPANP